MRKMALAVVVCSLVIPGVCVAADPPSPLPPTAVADNQAAGAAVTEEPVPGTDNQAAGAAATEEPVPATDNQATGAAVTEEPAPATDNQAAGAAGAAPSARPKPADLPPQPKAKPPVYLSMDFTDVDLPVLIKFISEQTKKNFIFDERVQGKITIISPRRITLDEAYNVFLSVLHVKGFATVEQDDTIKIIPIGIARQESLPTESDGSKEPSSKIITRLIPLQYVEVGEIVALLTPMISKDGLLTSFPTTNTLIVIDSRANIDRLVRILSEIDREGTGNILRIFPLKNASVAEIAKTLEVLYQETATPQPVARGRIRPGKARGPSPKFIPDPRTNILIVLAGKEMLDDIADLIS